jgi:transposase
MAKAENHPKPKKRAKKSAKLVDVTKGLSPMNLNAAGIAVGSAEHYVAVPIGRDIHSGAEVRLLHRGLVSHGEVAADCGVKSVVMQASGVYWIGLYPILGEHGLEVRVTNARYTQRLPGHKSHVQECQWLQTLHPCGLLPRSFRRAKNSACCGSDLRQRENLVAGIGICMQPIPKALTEMNLQRTNVLTDIRGKSGMAIFCSIVAGERDPYQRAERCDSRVHSTRQQVAQSLEGNWRTEWLFVVQQNLYRYDVYRRASRGLRPQDRIAPADHRPQTGPLPCLRCPPPHRSGMQLNRHPIPPFEVRTPLYQIPGVDRTQIDGMGVQTAEVLRSEVGADRSKGKNGKTFCFLVGAQSRQSDPRWQGDQGWHQEGSQPRRYRAATSRTILVQK